MLELSSRAQAENQCLIVRNNLTQWGLDDMAHIL